MKGVSNSSPYSPFQTKATRPSMVSCMSFMSTKDISISSWVNSGCLSFLESSSLKHLATW